MNDIYEPPSDFLKAIAADEIPLSGSIFADANLTRLVAMTRDADRANRDWAAMLLSPQDIDTPDVRAALRAAADDPRLDGLVLDAIAACAAGPTP